MVNVLGLVSFRVFPMQMGGQKAVVLFYRHLAEHVNVRLAVSKDNEDSLLLAANKVLFPNKRIYLNVFRLNALKRLALTTKADVIIAEHSYTGWIALLLHYSIKKPFIIHSQNIESRRFRQMGKWWWQLYQAYERYIHRKAQYNFFISEADRQFALERFHIDKDKSAVITYGVEEENHFADKSMARARLGLAPDLTILFFNGTLDYKPNVDAVSTIVDVLEQLLRLRLAQFKVFISGNRATNALIQKMDACANVVYTGYVDDVETYYQAADVFINPVLNDSGVKTKLVEAIANHCTAVSTTSGAMGIQKDVCGGKLITVADGDWNSFADAVVQGLKASTTHTPAGFFDFYLWKNVAAKAAKKIYQITQ